MKKENTVQESSFKKHPSNEHFMTELSLLLKVNSKYEILLSIIYLNNVIVPNFTTTLPDPTKNRSKLTQPSLHYQPNTTTVF